MFGNATIKRLTVHKIYSKSKTTPKAFSEDATSLCNLDFDGMEILTRRISSCFKHKSKFYELSLEDNSPDSFFEYQKPMKAADESLFIEYANKISDKCAESHTSANIPDGLLLVVDCVIDGFHSIVTVKAEKSDAFSANESGLSLVKNIFLSSDKTLYKVGFCMRYDNKNIDEDSFKYFVYDDAFTPSKTDLATYFYRGFLGLSTERNAKLLTNNLYKDLNSLIQDFVGLNDRPEMMDRVVSIFKDPSSNSLEVTDFRPLFTGKLQTLFDSEIIPKYPSHAIVKDLSIVTTMKSKKISLTKNATLVLKDWPEGVITGSTRNSDDLNRLTSYLETGGGNYNYAFIPSEMPGVEFIGKNE